VELDRLLQAEQDRLRQGLRLPVVCHLLVPHLWTGPKWLARVLASAIVSSSLT
jgi:hypothetical protein